MSKTKGTILIIDDDPGIRTSAHLLLKQHFTEVYTEESPRALPEYLNEDKVDVFLLDMNFRKGEDDGREGMYWLEYFQEVGARGSVIMMTAYGEVALAVNAIRKGASDFVLKPWSNEKLLATVHAGLKLARAHQKVQKLEESNTLLRQDMDKSFGDFVGDSPAIRAVFDTIDKVAKTDANILILGENGTGKELVAREIHRRSKRPDKPFVGVDLGALTETLFGSELFGHVKGAYTDAREDRAGRFELAHGGTMFLDEIGNLSLALQSKLLTVLQERRISRLGSSREIPVDFRLISATNMPIYAMVGQGDFRQDLLYRINTVEVRIPALRERTTDIPLLANHFLNLYARKYLKSVGTFSERATEKLMRYTWPGNVRELQHAVERAVIMAEGAQVEDGDLQISDSSFSGKPAEKEVLNLDENEKILILKAMERHRGNISKTAQDLGLTRAALYRRLEKHGIQ